MLERVGFAIQQVEYGDSHIFADYVCLKTASSRAT
jgi:hypothetical protein